MQLNDKPATLKPKTLQPLVESVAVRYKQPGKPKLIAQYLPPRLKGVALYIKFKLMVALGPHK